MSAISSPSDSPVKRVSIDDILSADEVDLNQLRLASFHGLDEGHRALSWQLLLFHLPPQRSDWQVVLEGNRETYRALCRQFIASPLLRRLPCEESDSDDDGGNGDVQGEVQGSAAPEAGATDEGTASVDPLSAMPAASASHIRMPASSPQASPDQLLIDEIVKDVTRTHQTYEFFRREAAQSLANILFLYAKLNPGISYVQGMNELVAPLLWVCAKHTGGVPPPPEQVEADTFGLFCRLMSEVKEMYMRSMDQEGEGIHGVLSTFGSLMARHEPAVTAHLLSFGIEPAFYAFRWLTALLSREFDLADTIRVWDSLFADPRRYTFLQFVCVAMVRLQRDALLTMDFGECVSLLQNYPPVPVDSVLACAERILQTENAQLRSATRSHSPQAIPAGVLNVMKRVTGAVSRTIRRRSHDDGGSTPSEDGAGGASPEVATPHPSSMPHSTDSVFGWLSQAAAWGSAVQSPPASVGYLGGTEPVRVRRRSHSQGVQGGPSVFTSASYRGGGTAGDQEMQAPRTRGGSDVSASRSLPAGSPEGGAASAAAASSPGAASLHTPVGGGLPSLAIPSAAVGRTLHVPVALPSAPATQASADVSASAGGRGGLFTVQSAPSTAPPTKGLFDEPTPGTTPQGTPGGGSSAHAAPSSRLSSLLRDGSSEEEGGGLFGSSSAKATRGGLFGDE